MQIETYSGSKEQEVLSRMTRVLDHYGFHVGKESKLEEVWTRRAIPTMTVSLLLIRARFNDPISARVEVGEEVVGTAFNSAGLHNLIAHALTQDHAPEPETFEETANGLVHAGPCRVCGVRVRRVREDFGNAESGFDDWTH